MTFCHRCYHCAVSLLPEEIMTASRVFLCFSATRSAVESGIMRGIHGGMLTLAEFHGIGYIIHVTHPPSSLFYSWSETEQQPRNHLRFHLPPITRYFHHRWVTSAFWCVLNSSSPPQQKWNGWTPENSPAYSVSIIKTGCWKRRIFLFTFFLVGHFPFPLLQNWDIFCFKKKKKKKLKGQRRNINKQCLLIKLSTVVLGVFVQQWPGQSDDKVEMLKKKKEKKEAEVGSLGYSPQTQFIQL